jgi:hypothetical protein
MRAPWRHVRLVPTTEVDFSLDHLVGEREKRRRDRAAERRSLGSPHGLAPGLVRGFLRFTSQKKVFRPMGWSKLAFSFWCDGLVRERLDRRRTAYVAADVAAAIASG